VTASDISLLSKELAVLIKAGLPMSTCLSILAEHSAKAVIKNALISVKKDIEGGGSLSEALAKSPEIFSQFYCTTVKSGEATDNIRDEIQSIISLSLIFPFAAPRTNEYFSSCVAFKS